VTNKAVDMLLSYPIHVKSNTTVDYNNNTAMYNMILGLGYVSIPKTRELLYITSTHLHRSNFN
jgi:ribonuclease HII